MMSLIKSMLNTLVKPYPARAVVAVKELPLGAKVEIIATASRKI